MNQYENGIEERIRYLNDLDDFLTQVGLSERDVCLVGSAVLADNNIRENNDLDITICPSKRGKVDYTDLPNEIDVKIEQYSWVGITDYKLVQNSKFHYESNGYKIIKPEIELSFKYRRMKKSDRQDFESHGGNNFLGFVDDPNYKWNWDLFDVSFYSDQFGSGGLPNSNLVNLRNYSVIVQFEHLLRTEGPATAIKRATRFGVGKLPLINRYISSSKNTSENLSKSDKSLYVIAFPTIFEFHDSIGKRLDSELDVIDSVEIKLEDNFENFLERINDLSDTDHPLQYKLIDPENTGTTISIYEVQCPMTESKSVDWKAVNAIKSQIRKEYYPYVPTKIVFDSIYMPSSIEEIREIEKIVAEFK